MPTLTELVINITGNPRPFLGATARVRAEYRALERDISIASARMAGNMIEVGRRATFGITLPILAAGAAVVKLSADFSVSLAKVSGLVNISRDQVNAWRGDILKLATETAKAPKELADALYFITSSGIEASRSMQILALSAKASAAGLGETQKVADTVTSILNAYRGTTLTAAQATDILIATVREGKAEPEELARVLGLVVATAAEMGVSFNDLGAAISGLTDVGLGASKSVTALRQIFITLLDPSSRAQKMLEHFGLSAAELRKEAQTNLIGALLHIKEAFHGNLEAISKVFGSARSLTGMLSLTGRQAEHVQEIFERLRHTGGDLDHAFKEAQHTIGFELKQAFASLQVAAIEMGDAVGPILSMMAEHIKNLASWFHELSTPQREVIAELLFLAAAVGPVLLILGEMQRVGKILIDTWKLMRGAQVLLGLALGATAKEALSLSTVLQYLWISAAPALGIIAGIIALGTAIYFVVKAYNDAHKSTSDLIAQKYEEHKLDLTVAESKYKNAEETARLVKQYNQLHDMTHRTVSQQEQMRQVMEKLNALNPELIAGFNAQTRELELVANAYAKASGQARALYIASNAARRSVAQDTIEQLKTQRSGLLKRATEITSPPKGLLRVEGGYTDLRSMTPAYAKMQEQWRNQQLIDISRNLAQTEQTMRDNEALIKRLQDPMAGYSPSGGTQGAGKGTGSTKITPYNIGPGQVLGKSGGSNKEAKDGLRLLEEYNDRMLDLAKSISLAGDDSQVAAAKWELYHGALSRTAKDGTKISEQQKQDMMTRAKRLDDVTKAIKANELFKSSMDSLNKEYAQFIANSDTEKADAERKFGMYKDLTDAQWKQVRAKIEYNMITKDLKDADEEENKRLQEKVEVYRQLQKEAGDYYANLLLQIREVNLKTEGDKVDSLFGAGGKFEKLSRFKLFGANIDFYQMMKGRASQLDTANLNKAYSEELDNLQKDLKLLGEKGKLEEMLWDISNGRFKDLKQDQKDALIDAVKAIDAKQKEIDAEKNYQQLLRKTRDEFRRLRIEFSGMTLNDRIDEIMKDSETGGKTGISRDQAKQIALMEQRIQKFREQAEVIKKIADGVADVFEQMIRDMWNNGFKNFFSNIVKGFQNMLRELALEYLKSYIRKQLLGLMFNAFGWSPDKKAAGGIIYPGRPTLVGERGPELIIPSQMGSVVNHDDLLRTLNSQMGGFGFMGSPANYSYDGGDYSSASSSASSRSTVGSTPMIGSFTMHVHGVSNPEDFRKNKSQLMSEAYMELQRHARRNNIRSMAR